MADFGFCGDAYAARSIYQNDQECINWYPEVDQRKQPGDRGYITLYPTPGLLTQTQLATGEVRCLWVLPGGNSMLAVSGSTVYRVYTDYTKAVIGSLFTSSGRVSIVDNGISAYIVDGGNRYTYDLTTGAFLVVPDTDGPFNPASTVDELDNIFIYNHPYTRQWAASDVASTVTNPLSLGQKFSASDNLVTLIADHRQVYLLGERTSEIDINAGSFPFTFQIVPSTTVQHGCAAAGSVSRFGESFAFIVQDTRGSAWVGQMSGYTINRISTYAIEEELIGQVLSDARSYTYQKDGHEFYVLILPTANKTLVYDLTSGMWHKWLEFDSFGNFNRTRTNCGAFFNNQYIAGDYQNGKIYALDFNTYTNDGDPIRRVRRCPHLTEELNRVYYLDFQIQFQPGVGLNSGQGVDPQAMLRWSDDGGSTWSYENWQSVGVEGNYTNRCRWTQLGTARDRVFEVVCTDPVDFTIVSANINVESSAY